MATVLLMAPAVMALRMPALMLEAMSQSGPRPETTRAWTEKQAAVAEGVAAMQVSIATATTRALFGLMTGSFDPRHLASAPHRAFDAAMKPIARRVRANHRRLSR